MQFLRERSGSIARFLVLEIDTLGGARFIAGDWGTTHLRLFLCDAEGNAIDRKVGPGASEISHAFASTFDSITSDWASGRGAVPAILCGMVGSRIGWSETPYVPSPVEPAQLASACLALRGGAIRIVPGISCRNRLGAPDLMRGEETQVLGALRLEPALREGKHLLCLPGTHTKWVLIEDGSIVEFVTAPAGELFALIRQHSVLVASGASAAWDDPAFERALADVARDPRVQFLHRVFQCRSRWMMQELPAESTTSYLSGLLIACDIYGAMDLFEHKEAELVYLIGSARLTHLYARAFAAANRGGRIVDGEAASRAGLTHLYGLSLRGGHAD